jgi:cellulose synthase/poly-beta-1,6-N-acetylglucosamine synthase-like glycosyltransferase
VRTLFWTSAAVIAYVYVGYPLLLDVWARIAARGRRPSALALPQRVEGVSIVIAARNEAARLPGRIRNLLTLDYPPHLRQIIVASDGSTDDTAEALACFADEIELIEVPPLGKAAALNAGVARARFDILVFTDARQTFATDALQALTRRFSDPDVGGVTGELMLGCEAGGRRSGSDRRHAAAAGPADGDRRVAIERRSHLRSAVAEGVGLYWRYEKALRRRESVVGSTLGATGAIYALRRSLWQPLPEGTLLDDVLAPMRAVLAGRRVIFEPLARAFDATPADSVGEARRKVRTLAGNFQILWLEPRLLVPFVNPVWLQYVSHKIGRLVVPYALLGLLTASLALAGRHPLYAAALFAQGVFYLLGAYGAWFERNAQLRLSRQSSARLTMLRVHRPHGGDWLDRTARIAFTFIRLNVAAVAALAAVALRTKVWRQ